MFTVMFDSLATNIPKPDPHEDNFDVIAWQTVEFGKRNIKMFSHQIRDAYGLIESKNATRELALKGEQNRRMLQVLSAHVEDTISNARFTRDLLKAPSQPPLIGRDKIMSRKTIKKMKSLCCLFTWDLDNYRSQKDVVAYIKNKYGDYNLEISVPVFEFERFILNIVLAYEYYQMGSEELAREIIVCIGKWLEEIDKDNDEFYRPMRDGLKHVLIGTFVFMKPTLYIANVHFNELMRFIVPYPSMNKKSLATVLAIKAAVLIEISDNEEGFINAINSAKYACLLEPSNSYWFYIQCVVERAHRKFKEIDESSPTENEINSLCEAMDLSQNKNINIKYHEIIIRNDEIEDKTYTLLVHKHTYDSKSLLDKINEFIDLGPKDPLMIINCAKILMSFPRTVQDSDFGMELLMKGQQMAPSDLVVLKETIETIILCQSNLIIDINNFLFIKHNCDERSERTKNQLTNDALMLAVETHESGIDPTPYLLDLLSKISNENTKWLTLAQICFYKLHFTQNTTEGLKYFFLLVAAEQCGQIGNDLIKRHDSLFLDTNKKYNLAQLVIDKIKSGMIDNSFPEEAYFFDLFTQLQMKYIYSDDDGELNVNKVLMGYNSGSEEEDLAQKITNVLSIDDDNDEDLQLTIQNSIQNSNDQCDDTDNNTTDDYL